MVAASSVSWLALLPGTPRLLPGCPTGWEPSGGKGVPVAGLVLSPVSLAGWMCRGALLLLLHALFHPICSGSPLHVEVIVCDTALSSARASLTTIILPLLPLSFKPWCLNCMLIFFSLSLFPSLSLSLSHSFLFFLLPSLLFCGGATSLWVCILFRSLVKTWCWNLWFIVGSVSVL